MAGALGAVVLAGSLGGLRAAERAAPPTTYTAVAGAAAGTTPTTAAEPATTTTTPPPPTEPAPVPTTVAPPPPPPPTPAPPPPLPPPPPAPPSPPRPAAPSFPEQVRALLPPGIEGRLPGWSVQWQPSRPGYLAVAFPATKSIIVYQRPGRSAALTAYDLAHEYGHAFDVTYLTGATRQAWAARRGYAAGAWFGCDMCNDFESPSGDWAESVAVCLTGNRSTFRSRLAGLPTDADCAWIAATVPLH